MEYNYNLQQIALGDLTFFCGEILSRHKKEDIININIDNSITKWYRNDSDEYKNFCLKYIKFILNDFNIKKFNSEKNNTHNWYSNPAYISNMFVDKKVRSIIKEKLTSGTPKLDSSLSIVLFTKTRGLHKSIYDSFSKKYFEALNTLDYNFILLGEKKVTYVGEYYNKNFEIYSLYDDYISNLPKEKIIDLTFDEFDPSKITIESVVSDLSLISNSKKMIMIGGGGFFCTSLFTDNLISLFDSRLTPQFNSEVGTQVFDTYEEFLNAIYNL